MYTRFITYDLKSANSYDYKELYQLLEKYHAKKITESTYKITTNEDYQVFESKFFKATKAGDNVCAIVKSDGDMKVWKIR